MALHPALSPRCWLEGRLSTRPLELKPTRAAGKPPLQLNGARRGIQGALPCFLHTLRTFWHRVRSSVVGLLAEERRHEHVDVLADHLFGGIAENPFGRGVDGLDDAAVADANDQIGRAHV